MTDTYWQFEVWLQGRFATELCTCFAKLAHRLRTSRHCVYYQDWVACECCRFLIQILPAAVVAPLYFQGKIGFGVINQSSSAFNHILSDVSLVVYQVSPESAASEHLFKRPIAIKCALHIELHTNLSTEFHHVKH